MSTRCSLQPSSAGAAEVVGAEVLVLHPGAERAVEHEHALGERVEEVATLRVRVPEGSVASGVVSVGHRRRVRAARPPDAGTAT